MKRTNFPSNKKLKLNGAIERLEARLALSDDKLAKNAKRFRNVVEAAADKAAIVAYRTEMIAHLTLLKAKVQG